MVLVLLVVVVPGALGAAGVAGGDRGDTRVTLTAGLGVEVPAGWHRLRGWLSDVDDPVPRLAVASFPARLSRDTCACGFPNVVDFRRDGAFVFVWESVPPLRPSLARVPRRPARFRLGGDASVRRTCDTVSDVFVFQHSGRVFQIDVYLGPAVKPALRERVAAMLASLHVAAPA